MMGMHYWMILNLGGKLKCIGVEAEEFGREVSPSLPSRENSDQELPPLSIATSFDVGKSQL